LLLALGVGAAFLLLALRLLARFRLLTQGALAGVLLTLGIGPFLLLGLLRLLARGVLPGLLAMLIGLRLVFVLLLLVVAVTTGTILRSGGRTHAKGEGGAQRNGPECLLAWIEFHDGFLA
jgi:hypothetical protein